MRMPFGKHRGKELRDVPESYLLWVLDNIAELSPTLRLAIEERLGVARAPPPPPPPPGGGATGVADLVRAWHRQMTLKYHPDRGGTHEQMLVVNDGAELLRSLAGL